MYIYSVNDPEFKSYDRVENVGVRGDTLAPV